MERRFPILCAGLIAFFITVPGVAMAEDWVNVARSKDNDVKAYVDVDSISEQANRKKFWMYHDFKGARSSEGKAIEKAYGYSVVDCEAKTIGYMETIIEWADGSQDKHTEDLVEEQVKPESVDAAVLKFVCEKKGAGNNSP